MGARAKRVFDQQVIEQIPVGRSHINMVVLIPGLAAAQPGRRSSARRDSLTGQAPHVGRIGASSVAIPESPCDLPEVLSVCDVRHISRVR